LVSVGVGWGSSEKDEKGSPWPTQCNPGSGSACNLQVLFKKPISAVMSTITPI
jgi:hypothetical protein